MARRLPKLDHVKYVHRRGRTAPLTAAELAERQKLRDVVATALAKDKITEMRDSERTTHD